MNKKITRKELVIYRRIEAMILFLRGEKVILDNDLAEVYGVTTARLNQQIRRNLKRFPKDFAFQLTNSEYENLMLQFATSSFKHGGRRKLPLAFTEHGVVMAANVLNSKRAVQMSVLVVRAFVELRRAAASYDELSKKLKELENRINIHDSDIQAVVEAIRELMQPPEKSKRILGFSVKEPKTKYEPSKRKVITS